MQIKNAHNTENTSLLLKRYAYSLAKVLISVLLIVLIYRQVSAYYDKDFFYQLLSKPYAITVIVSVAVLMLVNWYVESKKWRTLVGKFQYLSKTKSVQSVMSGVALAIVTPARLGEYGGRLINIEKENRAKALMANGVGSIAQNVTNITFGLVAMLAYISMYLDINSTTLTALISITGVLLMILITVYFRLDLLTSFLARYDQFKAISWLQEKSHFLAAYTSHELMNVLGLSTLRYIVFSFQYVLLILLCGVTTDPTVAAVGVGVIFFLQSGVPLPPILSVLARGEIAIWVWAVVSTNVLAILSATFILWIINLVIPALIGAFIIWKSDLSS